MKKTNQSNFTINRIVELKEENSFIINENLKLELKIKELNKLLNKKERHIDTMNLNIGELVNDLTGLHESDTFAEYWRVKYREELDAKNRLLTTLN